MSALSASHLTTEVCSAEFTATFEVMDAKTDIVTAWGVPIGWPAPVDLTDTEGMLQDDTLVLRSRIRVAKASPLPSMACSIG